MLLTKEVKMLKKFKLVFVTTAVLVGGVVGVAAAQGSSDKPDRAAMKEKFAEKRAEKLAQFDTNKNGVLDPAEKQAMHDARAKERFAALDANKDGVLSLDEFKAGKGRGGMNHGRKGHGKHRGMGGPGQP